MTSDQIGHLRSTWALMAASTDDVAARFYDRLFELDPSLRALFAATDMGTQGEKLVQTITVVVRGVEDLPRLLPAVEALGRRHVGYGVQEAHYATVGDALLWTFGQVLGDAFTPAARESWATAFGLLAGAMTGAARRAA
jgi:nitric oxide dioxygenase